MKTKIIALLLLCAGLAGVSLRGQGAQAMDASVQDSDSSSAAEILPLVQFEEAQLLDVIKTLARQAGINFIYDPQVVQAAAVQPDGTSGYPLVSIRLENVTAEAVLEALLNNNNLRLERDAKTGISRVTVKDPAAAEPLETRVFQLKYANVTNLVSSIKVTLGARSQAIADVRTSQMIVVATEKELLAIEDLIEKIDKATKQVLIEARIYETTRNPQSIKGANWAGTFKAQNVSFGNNSWAGELPDNPESPNTSSTVWQSPPGLLAFLKSGYVAPMAYLNADGARLVFSFFNEDSESEIIATPRAVTTDNQPALLSVSQAVPIFKVTQGGTQTGNAVDITYTNLGVILTVTPRISANDVIALQVEPEVSDISRVDRQTINSEEYTANVFSIRRINTLVSVPSGNTLVLGGLISDQERESRTKVPILGDLPGMKYVFGSKSKTLEKRNLLIFVTPTVVQDDDFQVSDSKFLQTPLPRQKDESEVGSFAKPWDGTEPYDWSKPVY